MGCEALLCLMKPFLIALLFSCLLSKASELSSALLLPTKFPPCSEKGEKTFSGFPNSNHCISKSLQTGDSQTLQSLPSSPTWAGEGWNPREQHPNPQQSSEPKPPGLEEILHGGQLTKNQPVFTSRTCSHLQDLFSPAFLQELLLQSLIPCSDQWLRLFWLQIPAILTRAKPANPFSSAWGSL